MQSTHSFPTIYSRTSRGQVQTWQIVVENYKYRTIEGIMGGKLTTSEWTICKGKNTGKKNETSDSEQAKIEAQAKWDKKIKENYYENIKEIDQNRFFEPQLAKKYNDYKDKIDFSKGVVVDDKLNGVRLILTKDGGFSRKGERFWCINHIIKSLEPLFNKYPNLILDGELYSKTYKSLLNRIASLVSVNRKEKDVTKEDEIESEKIIEYHVFDGFGFNNVTKDTSYIDRRDNIDKLIKGAKYVYSLPYKICKSDKEVQELAAIAYKAGEEGIMIKNPYAGYENKRSKNVLKLKNFVDEEYKVIDIKEGTGNWTGAAKIIVCELNEVATDGRTDFDSNIRGSMEELTDLFKNRKKHFGKMATVTYQEKSEFGIPLIPYTELPWRDYE